MSSGQYEKIPVLIRYDEETHHPVCICHRRSKKCTRTGCSREDVYRDKYHGWQEASKNREGYTDG